MTASAPSLPRAARLDRLPLTREHGRLVVGSGLGWALDAMDVGLISFVMAALSVQWQLTRTQLSWIGSIGFVGGSGLVFGTFAACFVLAAVATFGLPERRGETLDAVDAEAPRSVAAPVG